MAVEPDIPLPKWADEDATDSGTGYPNAQQPPESMQQFGYQEPGGLIPRQWFNWMWRSTYRWLAYLRQYAFDETYARENDTQEIRGNLLSEANELILATGDSGYSNYEEMVMDGWAKVYLAMRRAGNTVLGFFYSSTSSPANTGSGTDVLWTIPGVAGLLKRVNDSIRITGSVQFANNANNKIILPDFAGQGISITSGFSSDKFQNSVGRFCVLIVRDGANTAKMILESFSLDNQTNVTISVTGGAMTGLNFDAANDINLLVQGVDNGDIIGRHFTAEYIPARDGA